MIPITTRFTLVPYYGPDLDLTTAYPNKANVAKWSIVRADGAGDISNIPNVPFQALTKLTKSTNPARPNVYRLESKNLPSGGFQFDNGVPVTNTGTELYFTFDEGATAATALISSADKTGNFTVNTITGLTSPTYSLNGAAPQPLAVGKQFLFLLGDSLEIEGVVATTGTVILLPS